MKMFRWLAAGAAVLLLALLVFTRPSPFRTVSTPSSPATTVAGGSSAATIKAVPTAAAPVTSTPSSPKLPAAAASAARQPVGAFEAWAFQFARTDAGQRAPLLEKADQMAEARRVEMAALIQSNPEEALRRALPYSVRQQLPEYVQHQIEQPVNARGLFRPVCYTPFHAGTDEHHDLGYEVMINGIRFNTFTYGARLQQPTHDSAYIHGVSVKDDGGHELLALSAEAGRIVDDVQEKKDLAEQGLLEGDGAADPVTATVMQFGEKYFAFQHKSEAEQLNMMLKAAHGMIWASGGSSDAKSVPPDQLPPGNTSGTQGIKKLLYIRVLFADDPLPPQSDDAAQATAKANNRYFHEASYGTVWWESAITPLVRLPHRKNYYGENPGALLGDAATAAAEIGYFTSDYYSPHYVLHNSLPQYLFGGLSSGILNGSPGAITHELGHNFGLPHANFYQPEGSVPGPVQPQNLPPYPIDPDSLIGHNDINAPANLGQGGAQPVLEYGNQHDVMGSGGGHFSAMFKNSMDWLPDKFIHIVESSVTNRIYAFDTPRIDSGRLYAMRIRKDISREYWLSYRQGFPDNPWFSNGIEVDWNIAPIGPGYGVSLGNNVLIDTTPDSTYGKEDAALIVGRTMHDPAANLHVTPIALGGGPSPSDKWIDVVVNIGTFPDNQVPTLSLEASALAVAPGATVTFTATAQDADGDTLAYNWDFGDWTFGTNGPVQSKLFANAGLYVVRCEVSDMKGGVISRQVVLTVGSPTTYTISGRVLDVDGNPVQGVRVHNSGVRPADPVVPDEGESGPPFDPANVGTYRYGFTDIDGYYVIGNVPPGAYQVRAFKYGYSTTPFNFTDPVNLNNGHALNIDFVATKIARVRIAQTIDAAEEGGEGGDGIFTVSREGGNFAEELRVRFTLSGTAVIDTDYLLLGVNTTATNCTVITNEGVRITNCVTATVAAGELIIPPFQSSVDVHLMPIDNGLGNGDKTATMTLTLQTNFYRVLTEITNILTTNGSVIITNTVFTNRTYQFRVPGWELRPFGPSSTLTWFQTDPTYVLDQAEGTVTIQDDEVPATPTVLVATLDSAALESRGDTATLLFLRSGAPLDNPLEVHYALSGDAENGVDYAKLSGTVTIPAGRAFVLLPVTALNDLFVEGNEWLFLEILPAPGGEYALPFFGSFASALIVDDDLPLINIYSAISSVPRNGGPARVTVSRAGSVDEDLTVNYLVTGTAVSAVDFNTLPGSVVIPAGQLSADVNITPIAGSTNKLPRTVTIVLSDATTYNIYNQNSATITLFDNNLPTVTLGRTADALSEAGGSASFVVTRTGPTTASLNVFFDVGGSAWEGTDYASVGTNVVIPIGATTANITITAINDLAREIGDVAGQDTVIVRLRAHTNYNLGGTVGQTMRITDDEGDTALPSVGFMAQRSTVREDAGVANLLLKVTANPATNRPIQVEYRVTGGTAVPTVNYLNLFPDNTVDAGFNTTGRLSITHYFPPNPAPRFFRFENGIYSIPVPVLDDGVAAGDKTLTITLFHSTRFVTNTSLATNMGTVYTNILITRFPTNAYLGPSATHTLTIQDVKTSEVSVTATATHAYEAGPVPISFIVSRTGSTNVPLTVSFALEGTAASGSDYITPGTNGTVTIPAGTNAVSVTLMPIDDPTEENAESVVFTLLERPGYTVPFFQDAAQVIIVSDDGTIQFTSSDYHVSEEDGVASIPVTRTGGTNLTTTVDFLFTGGTALNDIDYLGTNGTLTFTPGETVKNIVFPIVNDDLVEADETVTLVLSNATGGVPLGGQRAATVYIVNDDTAFEFSAPTFRANENGVIGQVDIRRYGVLTNTDTVTFTATNGTAGAADYFASTFPVAFPPGVTNQTVSVFVQDDELFEGDETVNLSLTDPSSGTSLLAQTNAVLLIVDDECQLEFEFAGYSIIEYSNFVTLVVRRVGGTVNPVSVDYYTADGTATNGLDYGLTLGTVTFAGDRFETDTNGSGVVSFVPGQSNLVIQVPLLDDVLGEGNENFFVVLTNVQALTPQVLPGATLPGTNVVATVTILDNELPGQVDFEFNPGAGANAVVRSVSLAPRGGLVEYQGRTVIGGDFTTVDNFVFNRVARLLPDGSVDSSFNPGAGANSNVFAVAVQPDGRVVIGGEFTRINNTNRLRLARLNGDGKLDLSFDLGTNGVNGLVRAITLQTNGQVLIGGDFTQVAGLNRSFLARLQTNGLLDTNFFASLDGPVRSIAVQDDGRIVVGGSFTLAGGAARASLARLNTNGALDATFVVGSGFDGPVNAVAVQPDGKILAGGAFGSFNATSISNLVRLQPLGALDNTFKSGSGPDGEVFAVSLGANGRILLGGAFTNYNEVPRARFARLNQNGSVDNVFNIGTGANDTVRALAVQDDSAVIIGGDFTVVNNLPRSHIARIHGEERLDLSGLEFIAETFYVPEDGVVTTITVRRTGSTNSAFNVEFHATDGSATSPGDYLATSGLLSFAAGETIKTFEIFVFNDALVEGNETVLLRLTNAPPLVDLSGRSTATLIILDSARSVYFASMTYTVAEAGSNAVVTLVRAGPLDGEVNITLSSSNGTAAAGYDYAGFTNLITFADGESNKTVLLPLIVNDSLPEYTETIFLRLSPPSTISQANPATAIVNILDDDPGSGLADAQFNPGGGAGRFVRSLALQADQRLLVGGAFTNFAGSGLNHAVRLETNGAVDLTFNTGTGPNALVSGIAVAPGGQVSLAGSFSTFNGAPFNRLVRVTSNGVADVSFTAPLTFDSAINSLVVQADGRMVVGGAFKAPAAGVARVRVNATLDLQFDPGAGADGAVNAVVLQPDGQVIIGGGFTNVAGSSRPRVARLAPNGTLDGTFQSSGITNGIVFSVANAPGGKLLIGGNFRFVQGLPRSGVARLNGDGSLDTSFDPGTGVTGTVYTVSALANGSVFIGGDFLGVNGTNRTRYALLRPDGGVDASFDATLGADNTVYASLVTPAQQIVIGGDFTTVGGQSRRGVARLNVGGLEAIHLSPPVFAGADARVSLSTLPGNAYILEASDDLSYWFPLSTNLAAGATLEIADPDAAARSHRFYRARRHGP